MSRMGFPPASAGTSSGEWSLGGGRFYQQRNNAFTPNKTAGGGRSTMTASSVSRSAILPSAEVNVSKIRPMTGLARVDDRGRQYGTTASPATRVVESVGYYQSMVQSKIDDIVDEMDRLQSETEMADSESDPRKALDKKHDDLLKVVQNLEGDLADYNLAKEHARSGTHPEDVRNSSIDIISSNKKMENEIDKIFFKRKKAEDEMSKVESELKRLHSAVESNLSDSDADKVHEYRSLVKEIEDIIAETKQQEDDIVLMKHKLRMVQSNQNDGFHYQYKEEKKHVEDLKKQLEQVEEDIQLTLMTKDEAREHLLRKVCGIQLSTKDLEEESLMMQTELHTLQEVQKELRSELRMKSSGGAAYERLIRKDQEVKRYLQELPELKAKLEEERSQLLSGIETLQIDISQMNKMSEMELPSKEEMELMKDEAEFTGKQLDANQETMVLLQHQKKTRMEELKRVDTLEERIRDEVEELEKHTIAMTKEIEKYSNLGEVQDSADSKRENLVGMSEKYTRGIELLDSLIKEHRLGELESSPTWKALQELKSKLCRQDQGLFGLQDNKLPESRTDYGDIKSDCLQLMETINLSIISQSQ